MWLLHGIGWIIGVWPTPSGTPWTYQLWSGLIPALAVISVPFTLFRKHTCHIDGCWRIGKFRHEHYVLCKKHHPAVPGRITHEHVIRDYNEIDKQS